MTGSSTADNGVGRGVVAAAVGAATLIIGVVVGHTVSATHAKPNVAPTMASVATGDPGPRSVEANVPVGYARSRVGAVTAATDYLATAAERLLALDVPARQAAVARMLAPDAGAGLAEDMLSPLASIDKARQAGHVGGGRAMVRMVPLAYKVNAFSNDRAQIAVWSAGVFAIEGLTAPTEAWATTTVDLVWSGDWRLYSLSTTPGPVPAASTSAVTPAGELLDGVAGFSSYRYVGAS